MLGVLAATRPIQTSTWSVRAPSSAPATPLPGRSTRRAGRGRARAGHHSPWAARRSHCRGRHPDDGGTRPARRSRPRRVVDGHRGPSQERRSGGCGRASARRRDQGQTRFGTAVDLPTQSDKTYVLYAQPPAFGSAARDRPGPRTTRRSVSTKTKFVSHDATQLVVAVVAEHPERIVGSLGLLPNQNQVAPLVMSITPEDLPERVEAWNTLDRIVWQDIDADRLTPAQLDSLRGWVACGGRLVIAGGTAGPKALSAFPDVLLPYRPTATVDVPAASLSGLLGELPVTARTDLPALSGRVDRGPGPRERRRSGRGRRARLRRRERSPCSVSTRRSTGSPRRTPPRACGAGCCRPVRAAGWSSPTTTCSSARSRSCPRWRCRRSAA